MVDSIITDVKAINYSNSYLTNHVRKDGITCIFGSSSCVNWSTLVADYILHNLLINNRNEENKNAILCLNFDRHDLTSSTMNRLFSQSDNSYSRNLNILNYDMDDIETFTPIFQDSILLKITECMETSLNYAIIIYSLSELILTIGINETRYFVEKIQSLITNHNNMILTLNSSKYKNTENKSIIILVIHETLHSLHQLAEIQTTFQASTIIKVIPNRGTLSSEVVAELQTMRISRRSGKLKENIEMFGCKGQGRLYPLVNISNNLDNVNEDLDKECNIMSSLIDSSIDTQKISIQQASNVNAPDTNQRIITFDTNDPEFDEDSDPDADLDI